MNAPLSYILTHDIPDHLKPDQALFEAAHIQKPVVSVRVNPLKPTHQFDHLAPVPWCKNGYYLPERPIFTADPLLHAGAYYVQEASSMFLQHALLQYINFDDTNIVLDSCAAPGGKSTIIASLLNNNSLLIANEIIPNRAQILAENLTKWGRMNTWVTQNDVTSFAASPGLFNLVCIDAPCSGSGLFRRMPDYQQDWSPEIVRQCASRQIQILQNVYDSLCINGYLVYMTCSFSKQENEEIVDHILSTYDVTSLPIHINQNWGIVESQSTQHLGYGYRFFPHNLQGEGFFLSIFRKNDGKNQYIPPCTKNSTSPVPEIISTLFGQIKIQPIHIQDEWIAVPEHLWGYIHELQGKVKWIKRGIKVGKIIKNELIPDHEIAMYSGLQVKHPIIEVTHEMALQYLKKENIYLEDVPKGWICISYQHHILGWAKHMGNRTNNYYPAHYRIINKNILPE